MSEKITLTLGDRVKATGTVTDTAAIFFLLIYSGLCLESLREKLSEGQSLQDVLNIYNSRLQELKAAIVRERGLSDEEAENEAAAAINIECMGRIEMDQEQRYLILTQLAQTFDFEPPVIRFKKLGDREVMSHDLDMEDFAAILQAIAGYANKKYDVKVKPETEVTAKKEPNEKDVEIAKLQAQLKKLTASQAGSAIRVAQASSAMEDLI